MKAIIAINKLNYIGKNNELPWRCKEDLKHFKDMTFGKTCLVGHNTFKTLPLLKNRTIIIDKKGEYLEADWCIGGKKTYEKYLHLFTELHISHINNENKGDCFAPEFKNLNKECKIFNYYF